MNLADYINNAPKKQKKAAKKKAVKKAAEKPIKPIVVEKPISPIIKIIEQPNFSPEIIKQSKATEKLAEQAIASMRDSVNNNQAVMGEIVKMIGFRPIRFDIERDRKGDMARIIPVYE